MRAILFLATVAAVASAADSQLNKLGLAAATLRRHANAPVDGPLNTAEVAAAFAFEAGVDAADAARAFLSSSPETLARFEAAAAKAAAHELTTAPEQVHLGLTGDSGANVSVIWTTSTASAAARVCWREASASPAAFHCEAGRTWTYHPISVLPWEGNIHGGFMAGLRPGGAYEYTVGDPTLNTSSAVFAFNAPNLHTDTAFVAFGGDMGTIQLAGYAVADQMLGYFRTRRAFEAFWHLGDIAYSTLDPPKWNFEFFWDTYLEQEAPLLRHIPVTATYGNHDFSGGDSGAFINRFLNPRRMGGSGNFYFAFRQGPVLFVSMCTEVGLVPSVCDYAPGSAQYRWLDATLGAVNRTETPWVVLGGHRPMYSSDKSTDSGRLQEYMEPLLLKHKVDLELAGHMHETELTSPVANNVAATTGVRVVSPGRFEFDKPTAPVHVTVGTLGAVISERWDTPRPQWSMFRNGTLFDPTYGFATLDATRTSLTIDFLSQRTNSSLWSVVISK